MDVDEARKYLKGQLRPYVESITKKSKGTNMYVCPFADCRSGEGHNGTGAFSIKDGSSWKCFSCGRGGDIFDLIGEYEGMSDKWEQLRRAANIFGVSIDGGYQKQPKNEQYIHNSTHTTDYTRFFLQANKDIEKTSYHRGISLETLNRFKIGYVEDWKHPKAPMNVPGSPRLIIPTSRESYLARDTRAEIPDDQKPYSKSKVGTIHLFNTKALQTAKKPIYIVEGEIDALSIIDVGGEAVALGTTTKVRSFLDLVKEQKPVQPLIIALDNDEAGKKADGELSKGLEELGISFYRYNPAGDSKDANEAMMKDREAFSQAVDEGERIREEAEQAKKEEYLHTSAAYCLQSFIDGIADSVNTPYIATGFKKLDNVLDGGLYEGLYIVGAISSLGKTTLITQIADQIAQAGHDVLIFSLEMARTELMAKSISRHTLQIVLAGTGGDIRDAKTSRGITTGKRYEKYSQVEKDLIQSSIIEYSKYANHIYISEGIGDIGADQIRETVKQHIYFTGEAPVVIIDYLQILAPYSDRASDKQNMDKAVMELKRISRDYKIPVIGISSFNRQNYKEAVTMEAFKESGAIEYSSDVLIGLQLKGAGGQKFDANEAKRKSPREIELVILKNRNGRTGDTIGYRYYPLFNYFDEE